MSLKRHMYGKVIFLIIILFVPLFFVSNFFIGVLINIFYEKYDEMQKLYFNEYIDKKMEIGRVVLRNLRNNKEINMYIKDGSMLDSVPRKKEIEGHNYYRYIVDPINRVRISKIINELLADYGETSFEVYNDKKDLVLSIGDRISERNLINNLELSKNFGEISKFVIKNGNLYLQYYGLNTDLSSLLVLGIEIDDNDIYQLEKVGVKVVVSEKRSGEIVISSYFEGDKIHNISELKSKKYSKYKILDIKEIESYGKRYSIKIAFTTKREFYMSRGWQITAIVFALIFIVIFIFSGIVINSIKKMLTSIEEIISLDNRSKKKQNR